MKSLVFATNNRNKVEEMREVLQSRVELISLQEAGIFIDIPEPYDTLEANASEKSGTILRLTGRDCFSEDTALEVAALNGEPGVKSARYVEPQEGFQGNVEKLLHRLKNVPERDARFRTVISLRLDGQEYQFEGICTGKIIYNEIGSNGFGYDPVFVPDGADRTFGQMLMEEKAAFSHRGKAAAELAGFLSKFY